MQIDTAASSKNSLYFFIKSLFKSLDIFLNFWLVLWFWFVIGFSFDVLYAKGKIFYILGYISRGFKKRARSVHHTPLITLHYKMRQMSLQNSIDILLQNETKVYWKMCQLFYYKMRQFYYKCDSSYKMQCLQYTVQQNSQHYLNLPNEVHNLLHNVIFFKLLFFVFWFCYTSTN